MSEYFLKLHEELLHGIDMLAMWLGIDRVELEFTLLFVKEEERDVYRLDYLLQMLVDVATAGEANVLQAALGRMLALDAVIGANDRHAMNWGVIRDTLQPSVLRFAPVFDTARGLFWHHLDHALRRADDRGVRDGDIARYAERSRPNIGFRGWRDVEIYNHFELVRHILRHRRGPIAHGVREVLCAFHPDDLGVRLRGTCGCLVSRRRLEWIQALLHYRHGRLAALLRGDS